MATQAQATIVTAEQFTKGDLIIVTPIDGARLNPYTGATASFARVLKVGRARNWLSVWYIEDGVHGWGAKIPLESYQSRGGTVRKVTPGQD